MPATRSRKRERLPSTPSDTVKEMKNYSKRIKTEADSPTKSVLCPVDSNRSPKKSLAEFTHKPVKKEVEADSSESDSDSASDGEDSENEISAYEKRRQKNLQENAAFFSKLGIDELKNEFRSSAEKLKNKPSQRGLKKEKTNKNEPVVRRLSLRLQMKDPEGLPLPPESLIGRATYQYEPVNEHPRRPSGPLNMEDELFKEDIDDHNELIDLLERTVVNHKVKTQKKVESVSIDSFVQEFTKITLTANRVAKVVPERIFSVAIHPSEQVTLVVAGDKWGRVGLWNVMAGRQYISDGVVAYTPHSRPVNCIKFCPQSQHKMFSCSYDGTLRCCDIEKTAFDEIYTTPEEDDNLLKNFDFLSPESLIVAQQDGTVAVADLRVKKDSSDIYTIHNKAFRSVSVHPLQKHIFASAGDGTVSIWDLRKLKTGGKKNNSLDFISCGANVNSAYFSPLTGKYILSASINDRICIYNASDLDNLKIHCNMKHDNHVGRWLTGFRPTWHPQREDLFVSGSMSRPRQIELIGIDGKHIKDFKSDDLGSVCSLNEIHPTKNILVGGNSSGRLHVFM